MLADASSAGPAGTHADNIMTTLRSDHDVLDIADAGYHHVAEKLDGGTVKDAAHADEIEHKQTLCEALAIHEKAIFWSMALSAALIAEGYDVVVIGSYHGHRQFSTRCTPSSSSSASFLKRFLLSRHRAPPTAMSSQLNDSRPFPSAHWPGPTRA